MAGHKGQPAAVAKKGWPGRCRRLAGAPGRGTLEKDKPPILGLIQRGGQVVLRMLANVQQKTIKPVITAVVASGTLVHTDEYAIHTRFPARGWRHKTICHARGVFARDEDGFCEVHADTTGGFRPLLHSWLRPHRGILQDRLPDCLGFLRFVHNARRRGEALPGALMRAWLRDGPVTTPEPNESLRAFQGDAMTCLPVRPPNSAPDATALVATHTLSVGQGGVSRRATLDLLRTFFASLATGGGSTGAAGSTGSGSTGATSSGNTGAAGVPAGRLGYPAVTSAVRNMATTPAAVTVPTAPSRSLPAFTADNARESPNGKVLDKTNHSTDHITLGDGTTISLTASTAAHRAGMFTIMRNGRVMNNIRLDLLFGVHNPPLAMFDDAIQIVYYFKNCYIMTDHGLGAQTWFKLEGTGPDIDTEAGDPRVTFLVADAVAPAGDPPYGLGTHPGSIGTEPRFSTWLAEFSKEVGRPAYVNAFADGSDFSKWGNDAYTAAQSLAATSLGKAAIPVYGLPMARGGQAIADFTAFANGTYDQFIRDGVKGYFAFFDEVHVRPGYEMNGTFMNWFWGGQNGDTKTGPIWLSAFKRIYMVAHQAAAEATAASGRTKTVAVTWNPCHQNFNAGYNPKDMYPGNDHCDYHGLDVYSPQYTQDASNWSGDGRVYDASNGPKWRVQQALNPINRIHFWDYPAAKFGIGGGNETGGTAGWGMQDAIAFAQQCGKPLAFPECGAGQNFADAGLGPAEDEVFPYYLRSRCDQAVNAGVQILYLNIWSADEKDGGWGYMFRQRPKQAIAWASAFGGTGAAIVPGADHGRTTATRSTGRTSGGSTGSTGNTTTGNGTVSGGTSLPASGTGTPSADGSTLASATGSLVDAAGIVWQLKAASSGFLPVLGGVVDDRVSGNSIQSLYYHNNLMHAMAADGKWYYFSYGEYHAEPDPHLRPPPRRSSRTSTATAPR